MRFCTDPTVGLIQNGIFSSHLITQTSGRIQKCPCAPTVGGIIKSSLGNDVGRSLQEVRCVEKNDLFCSKARTAPKHFCEIPNKQKSPRLRNPSSISLSCTTGEHQQPTHTLGSPAKVGTDQIHLQHLGAAEPPHRLLNLRLATWRPPRPPIRPAPCLIASLSCSAAAWPDSDGHRSVLRRLNRLNACLEVENIFCFEKGLQLPVNSPTSVPSTANRNTFCHVCPLMVKPGPSSYPAFSSSDGGRTGVASAWPPDSPQIP